MVSLTDKGMEQGITRTFYIKDDKRDKETNAMFIACMDIN
jgi:hypothetical protein